MLAIILLFFLVDSSLEMFKHHHRRVRIILAFTLFCSLSFLIKVYYSAEIGPLRTNPSTLFILLVSAFGLCLFGGKKRYRKIPLNYVFLLLWALSWYIQNLVLWAALNLCAFEFMAFQYRSRTLGVLSLISILVMAIGSQTGPANLPLISILLYVPINLLGMHLNLQKIEIVEIQKTFLSSALIFGLLYAGLFNVQEDLLTNTSVFALSSISLSLLLLISGASFSFLLLQNLIVMQFFSFFSSPQAKDIIIFMFFFVAIHAREFSGKLDTGFKGILDPASLIFLVYFFYLSKVNFEYRDFFFVLPLLFLVLILTLKRKGSAPQELILVQTANPTKELLWASIFSLGIIGLWVLS